MDDRLIARWRMQTLRLAGQSYSSAVETVAGILTVQAEQYSHTAWRNLTFAEASALPQPAALATQGTARMRTGSAC